MQQYCVRKAKRSDFNAILKLHRKVSKTKDGIARAAEEITKSYVKNFIKKADKNGLILVIENPKNHREIIAEMHCYSDNVKSFNHVFSNLTIVVDSDHHNQGLGRKIFSHLLEEIRAKRQDIKRVELRCRTSNKAALHLYQSLGFKIEGICKNGILNSKGELEDDCFLGLIINNS